MNVNGMPLDALIAHEYFVAGETFPAASVARTVNECEPVERWLYDDGDEHAASAAVSS